MAAIPIITFLHDLVSATKGPYYRLVGRHTQRYCTLAAKLSTNEQQKRILFIAAAGADEVVARSLGVHGLRQKGKLVSHAAEKRVTKQQVSGAMRVYVSAVLVMLGAHKDLLLQMTALSEQDWIERWCQVFEYQPADMQYFNEVLLPSYQQQGFDGLASATGDLIATALFASGDEAGSVDLAVLNKALINDVSAILKSKNEG